MDINPNRELSIQMQQKLEFYFIALIFTLLSLAVQSSEYGNNPYADTFEIISWLLLLSSGLMGLSRIEWLPVAYKIYSKITDLEKDIEDCVNLQGKGQNAATIGNDQTPYDIPSIIKHKNKLIEKLELKVKPIEKKAQIKYNFQKSLFLFGLISLMSSRAYLPVISIIESLK